MQFQRERLTESLWKELSPLFEAHFAEIKPYAGVDLAPDFKSYLSFENAGILRVFTARDAAGECVGYGFYTVAPNPHFRRSLQAHQDVLFIHPERRGRGARFITFTEGELAREGVEIIHQHVTPHHDFSSMLVRMGYEPTFTIYAKRLPAVADELDRMEAV